jgi:hypothetical protein
MTKIFKFLKKQDKQQDAVEILRAEAAKNLLLSRMDRMLQAEVQNYAA